MKYIEALEEKINSLQQRGASSQESTDERSKKWGAAEELYLKQLHDKDTLVDQLTKQVDSLTFECKQLTKRYEMAQIRMDEKLERLDMLHDVELRAIRRHQKRQDAVTDQYMLESTKPNEVFTNHQQSSSQPQPSAQPRPLQLSPSLHMQHKRNVPQQIPQSSTIPGPTLSVHGTSKDEHTTHPTIVEVDDENIATPQSPPLKSSQMECEPAPPPIQDPDQQAFHVYTDKPTPPPSASIDPMLSPLHNPPTGQEPIIPIMQPVRWKQQLPPLSPITNGRKTKKRDSMVKNPPPKTGIHFKGDPGDSHQGPSAAELPTHLEQGSNSFNMKLRVYDPGALKRRRQKVIVELGVIWNVVIQRDIEAKL